MSLHVSHYFFAARIAGGNGSIDLGVQRNYHVDEKA
jgi:hypothetical protein